MHNAESFSTCCGTGSKGIGFGQQPLGKESGVKVSRNLLPLLEVVDQTVLDPEARGDWNERGHPSSRT